MKYWKYFALFTILTSYSVASSSETYTISKFLNASEKELLLHKQNLDKQIEQKKLNITQSEAMLFYPNPVANQKLLRSYIQLILRNHRLDDKGLSRESMCKWFNKNNLPSGVKKALNDALVKEEEEHRKGALVFYHSTQPLIFAHHYIDTGIEKLASELKGKPVKTDMLLLRNPKEHLVYPIQKFIRKKFMKEGGGCRRSSEPQFDVNTHALSVNTGITGNTNRLGESTLNFFLNKKNVGGPWLKDYMQPDDVILDKLLISQKNELAEAIKKFNEHTKSGVLLQLVFKDPSLVNKVVYNTYAGGQLFGPKTSELHGKETSDPMIILNTIKTNPKAFSSDYHTLNDQQMRIILTGDKLLDINNPEITNNFAVNAYTTSDKSLKEFKDDVDNIMNKTRINYLSQKGQLSRWKGLKYGVINFFRLQPTPLEQRENIKRMKFDQFMYNS